MRIHVSLPEGVRSFYAEKNMPIPPPVEGTALIDTGATRSAIDSSVVWALGLVPKTTVNIVGSTGVQDQDGFAVRFVFPDFPYIPGQILQFDPEIVTASPTLALCGLTALLGRDFLTHMILIYDGKAGRYTICF